MDSSNASTTMITPALELDWPSANESWIDIVGASGLSQNLGKDRPSSSPSQHEIDKQQTFYIVVMEDNKADVFLVEEAIAFHEIHAVLQVITDGEEAIRRVEESNKGAPSPDLFILDLNLPKRSGHEILAAVRRSPEYAHIPVLIMTSSDSAERS